MIHQAGRKDLVQIMTEKPVPEEMKLVVLATPSLLLNIYSYTWEYVSRAPLTVLNQLQATAIIKMRSLQVLLLPSSCHGIVWHH